MISVQANITGNERSVLHSREDRTRQAQTSIEEKKYTYAIHNIRRSENAVLLFNSDYVFKILQPYKDQRYSLKERSERQDCLIEGWRWNTLFTRGIHRGLARLYNYDPEKDKDPPSRLEVGRLLDPNREELDKSAEYALVMRKLPKSYRLDMLLKDGDSDSQKHYTDIMTQFLVHIHASLAFQLVESGENKDWGSVGQLAEKLIHNLVSVETPCVPEEIVLKSARYRWLQSLCASLREKLLPVLTDNKYREFQQFFTQRVKKQQIRRCHGDLKARNIWIMPDSPHQDMECPEIWNGVRVLDAIDFNPEFSNIDILSDFAMLVADVDARAGSSELASSMIKDYLRLTKQEDKGSRFILNYYLVEKAFVGALVSILYDKNSWLSQRYLHLCERYLAEFEEKLPHTPLSALVSAH